MGSAMFALAAFQRYTLADSLTFYPVTMTICGQPVLCDPLFLYEPLWPRSYPDDTVRGADKLLRTPGGGCLDVVGGAVVVSLCNPLRASQRWELSRGGAVRNAGANKCLAAANANAGQPLSLRTCAREPSQRFYLTTQRQPRGPDATCVSQWFGQVLLAECGPDSAQLGFVLR